MEEFKVNSKSIVNITGSPKSYVGSRVEDYVVGNDIGEELTPEQKEILDFELLDRLYFQELGDFTEDLTQEDILQAIEHGTLPSGMTFEQLVEYSNREDLCSDF